LHAELRRSKHVTKALLWQEYRQAEPEGVQYSQFCELYTRWLRHAPVTMRQECDCRLQSSQSIHRLFFVSVTGRAVSLGDCITKGRSGWAEASKSL
jgi:hypothetical protein